MVRHRFWEHIPELFVALCYYPSGAFLATILHSFQNSGRTRYGHASFVWALSLAVVGALCAALILCISKAVAKRIVWLHMYLLAVGNIFLLTCGLMLMANVNRFLHDYSLILVWGALGHGLVYITGMSYIHTRTNSYRHRVARVALCHLILAIGMASSTSYIYTGLLRWRWFYDVYGYFITYGSGTVLVCVLLNELLHGLGLYNYKRCLDMELREADEKKDRFKSALTKPGTQPERARQRSLTIIAVCSKLLSGFVYNNVFLLLTMIAQTAITGNHFMLMTISHYFLLAGIVLGISITLSARIKVMYPVVLISKVICLTIAAICWTKFSYIASGVFFWMFYLIGGAGVFVPDVAIMEVSHPAIFELNLFFGFALEQIPIIVSIYLVRFEPWAVLLRSGPLWASVGICIGLAVLMTFLFGFFYPNTFHLRVLEIQRLILFNNKERFDGMPSYLATNTSVPVQSGAAATVIPTMHYASGPQQPQHMMSQPQPPMMAAYPQQMMMQQQPPPSEQRMVMPRAQMMAPPQPQMMAQNQFPSNHQPYLASQPAYPGQQPVYPQYPYYPGQMAGSTVPTADMASKSEETFGSAPQLTPVTETEQVFYNQRMYGQLPPAYGNHQ